MKALIVAGTRGIGGCIADQLEEICEEVVRPGKSDLDTSNIEQVKNFANEHPEADILVLNTGGPPAIPFEDISDEEWNHWFNQLFLSFVILLREIKIKPRGYVFLISSFNIREPSPKLVLSNSLRLGFTSVFKTLSQLRIEDAVSFVNIAPGPVNTERLVGLQKKSGRSIEEFANRLESKRITEPEEIGLFVRSIVENELSGLNGVTIPFDMGLGKYVL